MASVTLEYVGLIRPDAVMREMERVGQMIRDGFTSGELTEGGAGWWKCDGVDAEADAEDNDDGAFDEAD